jgi:DNA-binding NarL/FixJ family response regulator
LPDIFIVLCAIVVFVTWAVRQNMDLVRSDYYGHEILFQKQIKPDLALVDITLRSGNGLELIKDLRIRVPSTAILVMSMHDESLYAERVLRSGGQGYIMKQEGDKS